MKFVKMVVVVSAPTLASVLLHGRTLLVKQVGIKIVYYRLQTTLVSQNIEISLHACFLQMLMSAMTLH